MPPGLDPGRSHIVRLHNVWECGKEHFAADAELAAIIEGIIAEETGMSAEQAHSLAVSIPRQNRAFTARAVNWAAARNITQFIHAGPGAQRLDALPAGARGVWVTSDPAAAAYARAFLKQAGNPEGIGVVLADGGDPGAVWDAPGVREVIDLGRPVCVVLAFVLALRPPEEAAAAVAGYAQRLTPGSAVAVTCGWNPGGTIWQRVRGEWAARAYGDLHNHDPQVIRGWLEDAGLVVAAPGVRLAREWVPGMHVPDLDPDPVTVIGGAGVKRQALVPGQMPPTA